MSASGGIGISQYQIGTYQTVSVSVLYIGSVSYLSADNANYDFNICTSKEKSQRNLTLGN